MVLLQAFGVEPRSVQAAINVSRELPGAFGGLQDRVYGSLLLRNRFERMLFTRAVSGSGLRTDWSGPEAVEEIGPFRPRQIVAARTYLVIFGAYRLTRI